MKDVCDKKMSFQDCELAILRAAVDEAEDIQGRKSANSPEIKKIIIIVENFLTIASLIFKIFDLVIVTSNTFKASASAI